jgi:probable rRNA maturation factor
MEIFIDSRQTRIDIDRDELRRKAERILGGLDCNPDTVLSLLLVDSAEMTQLNSQYRGKDYPTNVLSFSQAEGEATAAQPSLLGDVVICTDRAADDAKELGYTDDEMVTYLLIHGILHLVGFVHDRPQDAAAMSEQVNRIFDEFYPQVAE